MYRELSHAEQKEIEAKVIKLLESENCTVRQARDILTQAISTIRGTAPVRFVDGIPYEF